MIEQMIVGQVFGDTVELASLMESSGSAMKIQITSATKVEYYSLCLSIALHSVSVNGVLPLSIQGRSKYYKSKLELSVLVTIDLKTLTTLI